MAKKTTTRPIKPKTTTIKVPKTSGYVPPTIPAKPGGPKPSKGGVTKKK